MRIIQSPRLAGFAHGFTTRQGGASERPFDTLNLGVQVGDAPARVAENWARLEGATGLGFARVRQVHGARAVRAHGPCAPAEEADAVLSLAPGVAACVSIADCVPVDGLIETRARNARSPAGAARRKRFDSLFDAGEPDFVKIRSAVGVAQSGTKAYFAGSSRTIAQAGSSGQAEKSSTAGGTV